MEEILLRPCPFCGGEAAGMSFVHCRKCGALGKKVEISRKYCSDEKAAEAWNGRANV